METATPNDSGEAPRTPTPVLDEEMSVRMDTPMAELSLTEDEMRSDYVHPSFFTKKGVIIQFVNGNCPGTTSMIGGIRLSITDIRKIPAYIFKYKQQIKAHAVRSLLRHFKEMQCGLGATEALCSDDYGLAFSVASLSLNGIALNPGSRNEGPLFYCHCPALLGPTMIKDADWQQGIDADVTYVINAYVHLLPQHQRRCFILWKAKEDKAAAMATPSPDPKSASHAASQAAKKPKMTPVPSTSGTRPAALTSRSAADQAAMSTEIGDLKRELAKIKGQLIPSPALPATKPPRWPSKDVLAELPEDL